MGKGGEKGRIGYSRDLSTIFQPEDLGVGTENKDALTPVH